VWIPDPGAVNRQDLVSDMIRTRHGLQHRRSDRDGEFAFLPVDGKSRGEDALVSALAIGLVFGGLARPGGPWRRGAATPGGSVFCAHLIPGEGVQP